MSPTSSPGFAGSSHDGGWPTLDVAPGISVRITRAMPPLDPALDAAVERHWLAARRRHDLFNGQVFCADRVGPDLIEGHWTEYRRQVAQFADPTLAAALGLRCLAVCGAVCGPDGVVLGRRDPGALYQPGEWQLPPAGSVDRGAERGDSADLRTALLAELQEELGIGADAVEAIRPLCLVTHPSGVLDLGLQVTTRLTGAEILAARQAHGNQEYATLAVIPPGDIPAYTAARHGTLVPTAHELLRRIQ